MVCKPGQNATIWLYILICSQGCGIDRQCMDRRRLEEAHLKFCILDVFKRYPRNFPHWHVATNLQQALDTITPAYYEAFCTKYAGM